MTSNLVFIGSGGRTGTSFLGNVLSSIIEDCYSEHEPDLFLGFDRRTWGRIKKFGAWHMVFARAVGLSGIRVTGTKFLTGRIHLTELSRDLQRQRSEYHKQCARSLLIESYYAWWMVAPHLNVIFPGCKFIGVVRDPRSWISSWQAHYRRRDRGHWSHYVPPGPINAITTSDPLWAQRWEEIGPIGRLAWQWMFICRQMSAADRSYSRIFRFEDLFRMGQNTGLAELVKFSSEFPERKYEFRIPASITDRKINSSSASGAEWEEWSAAEKAIVNEICGPFMSKFGYEPL